MRLCRARPVPGIGYRERRGPFSSARLTGRMAPAPIDLRCRRTRIGSRTRLPSAPRQPTQPAGQFLFPPVHLSPEFATQVGLFLGLLMALVAICPPGRLPQPGQPADGPLGLPPRRARVALWPSAPVALASIRQLMTESLLLSTAGGRGRRFWRGGPSISSGADVSTPIGPAAVHLDVVLARPDVPVAGFLRGHRDVRPPPALPASDSSVSSRAQGKQSGRHRPALENPCRAHGGAAGLLYGAAGGVWIVSCGVSTSLSPPTEAL